VGLSSNPATISENSRTFSKFLATTIYPFTFAGLWRGEICVFTSYLARRFQALAGRWRQDAVGLDDRHAEELRRLPRYTTPRVFCANPGRS